MSQSQKKYFNSKDARNLINIYKFALFPIHGIVDGRCTCGEFPCGKENKNAGKHPATPNGLTDATKDIEQLKILWNGRKHLNVAIATGAISNIFVVDIDGEQGEKDIAALGELPQTLMAKTGKGRHIFFKYPGVHVKSAQKVIGNKVDIRGDGGYVAGVGSNHVLGSTYEWINPLDDIMDAPKWLLTAMENKEKQTLVPSVINTNSVSHLFSKNNWSESDVSEMLAFISADCGYDEWIQIGMAIQSEGFGFHVWDSWSKSCPSRYDAKTIHTHWKSFKPGRGISFGTLVQRAQVAGWMRVSNQISIDEQKPQVEVKKIQVASRETNIENIKFTGLIGNTIDDILATSQKPQPELTMLNVLAALGAVYGRRYASPMDTRTNLYTVGIAYTGAGKDHSRKYIKSLLFKAQMETFLGDDSLVSGAGLLASVAKKPSQIMHIDEFGMVLADIKSKNTGSHMKICAKIMTELYSASNSHYFGGQYADPKRDPVRIQEPNLCIYGTTTLEKYIESMDRSVISSGELNRYIIIKPKTDFPERVRGIKASKPSQSIVDSWTALMPLFGANAPVNDIPPIQVTWDWLDDRVWNMQIMQDEKSKADPLFGALWARYAENVIKIAMIMSISRNRDRPNIENEDFDIAEKIVRSSVEYMAELARTNMYDSQHEKDCNRILDIIKKFGKKMPKSSLTDRTRDMEQRSRDSALTTLEERLAISIEKEDRGIGGRPKYFITAL